MMTVIKNLCCDRDDGRVSIKVLALFLLKVSRERHQSVKLSLSPFSLSFSSSQLCVTRRFLFSFFIHELCYDFRCVQQFIICFSLVAVEKIIKAKWKGLRDNFRIQWKMIPRDEHDQLLINPEEFTGTKWQYYRPLLFLADNMGKSRNSYSHYDDNSYELLQSFEPAIEIPSDDEIELK